MSLSNGFDLEGFLRLDSSDFEEGAQQAKSEMGEVEQQAESTGEAVESSFGDRLVSAGETARNVGAGLTAGITAPLAAVGYSSIQAASKAEEAQARFESVFQNTNDRVSEFADTFADEIGRSEHTIENMAANFGSMLNPMLESEEQVAELSTKFTKLTQDLASFENRNPAKVQRDLQSALAGQSETVRKYGVDLSQARLKQMGLTEESSRAEEAQLRLKAIIEDTASAQDNAAETSDSFANQQRALRADVKDLRIEIGQELLPIAKDLIDAIRPAIDTFEGLSGPMQRAVLVAGGIAAALGPVLLIAGQLAVTLPALAGAASTVAGALGTVAAVATGPVGIAVAIIAGLALLFKDDLIPVVKQVADFIRDDLIPPFKTWVEDTIEGEVMPALEEITTEFEKTADAIRDAIEPALGFLSDLWEAHGDTVIDVVDILAGYLDRTFDNTLDILVGIVTAGLALIRGDWDSFADSVERIVDAMWSQVESTFSTAVGIIDTVTGGMVTDIKNLFRGLRSWVGSAWDMHPLSAAFEGARKEIANEDGGIIAKLTAGVRGALDGLAGWVGSAWDWSSELRDAITAPFDDALSAATDFVDDLASRLSFDIDPDIDFPDLPDFGGRSGNNHSSSDSSSGGGGGITDPTGGDVPGTGRGWGLATGGFIETGGVQMLHANERVLPQSQVSDRGEASFDPDSIADGFDASDGLGEVTQQLSRIADLLASLNQGDVSQQDILRALDIARDRRGGRSPLRE